MGIYRIHLVGESHYQDAIARERPGNRVRIEAEPDNRFDPKAIRIASVTGRALGYIPRDSWVQRAFHEDDLPMSATIDEIIGGTPAKPILGVTLELRTSAHAEPGI